MLSYLVSASDFVKHYDIEFGFVTPSESGLYIEVESMESDVVKVNLSKHTITSIVYKLSRDVNNKLIISARHYNIFASTEISLDSAAHPGMLIDMAFETVNMQLKHGIIKDFMGKL